MDLRQLATLEEQVLAEIDRLRYSTYSSGKDQLFAEHGFYPFVVEEANRLGIKVLPAPTESIIEFNRNSLTIIRRAFLVHIHRSLLNVAYYSMMGIVRLLFQFTIPSVVPYITKEDRLTSLRCRFRVRVYPTLAIPIFFGVYTALTPFYRYLHLPISPGVFSLYVALLSTPLTWLACLLFPSMEGHELGHVYQFVLAERIRQEMHIPLTTKQVFIALSGVPQERLLLTVIHRPPSLDRLRIIVRDVFARLGRQISPNSV